MKTFRHFFKIELKRLFNWITVILVLLFLALAMYFIHDGANQYKDILNNKDTFKKIEQAKVKRHYNYTIYGMQGFRILFIPSPLSIFTYNSGAFSDLSANIDVGERLNLTGSYKGPNMFREKRVMYADFHGLHLLFGILIVLIYGFLSFRYGEYLKLLGSLGGFKKVYILISCARLLLLGLFFFVVTALGVGLALLKGIAFTGSDYLYIAGFFGLWLLAVLVIFSIGAWIGAIKSNPAGITVLMVTWVFLFYISPLAINNISDAIADNMKSIYQLEKEKWDALMGFEKRAEVEEGKFKKENAKTPTEQEMIESFMNREYKEMTALEKGMEKEMRENIKLFEWLSLSSPTAFLSAAAGEMSGKGFHELGDFYKYVQEVKDKFSQFYKNKKFYSEEEANGVESFIKDEENLYYGKKSLPSNLGWGVLELLVLFLVFQVGSYFTYRRVLARVEGEAASWDPAGLKPAKGKHGIWQIEEEGYANRAYNFWKGAYDFLYLCHVDRFPGDICAGDLLALAAVLLGVELKGPERYWGKRFSELGVMERFGILLVLTELAERGGKGYYLFHDIVRGMPAEAAVKLKGRMGELASGGASVVFLLRDQLVSDGGGGKHFGIREAPSWPEQVEHWKNVLEKG